jgi:hypothetical protein
LIRGSKKTALILQTEKSGLNHDDFVLLDICREKKGFAILATHVKSDTCVENKFILGAQLHGNFVIRHNYLNLNIFNKLNIFVFFLKYSSML